MKKIDQLKLTNLRYNIFPILRIIFYLTLTITFIIIDPSKLEESGSFCYTFNRFGFLCPTCGVTRGFCNFIHLNFTRAFSFNPIFTLSIFPLSLIFFINDIYVFILRIITKKEKYSYLEYFIKDVINI